MPSARTQQYRLIINMAEKLNGVTRRGKLSIVDNDRDLEVDIDWGRVDRFCHENYVHGNCYKDEWKCEDWFRKLSRMALERTEGGSDVGLRDVVTTLNSIDEIIRRSGVLYSSKTRVILTSSGAGKTWYCTKFPRTFADGDTLVGEHVGWERVGTEEFERDVWKMLASKGPKDKIVLVTANPRWIRDDVEVLGLLEPPIELHRIRVELRVAKGNSGYSSMDWEEVYQWRKCLRSWAVWNSYPIYRDVTEDLCVAGTMWQKFNLARRAFVYLVAEAIGVRDSAH